MAELIFWDANAFIGRHDNPYAPSPFTTAAAQQVIAQTDGLAAMLVYHAASRLYSAGSGNGSLLQELGRSDAVLPACTILPDFAPDENAAAAFVQGMRSRGFVAAAMFCATHNFITENHSMDALLRQLQEQKIPLRIDQDEISWQSLQYILQQFPQLPVILCNVGYRLGRYIEPLLQQFASFHLEISRYQVHRGLETLYRRFGSDRLIFGSGLPIFSPEAAMHMVATATIPAEAKLQIAGGNLRRLLHRDTA